MTAIIKILETEATIDDKLVWSSENYFLQKTLNVIQKELDYRSKKLDLFTLTTDPGIEAPELNPVRKSVEFVLEIMKGNDFHIEVISIEATKAEIFHKNVYKLTGVSLLDMYSMSLEEMKEVMALIPPDIDIYSEDIDPPY